MSQLSADLVQSFETPNINNDIPIADNVVVYRGSAIGLLAGYGRQLVAGDVFVGFAEQKVDNTATGHAAGLKTIPVRKLGTVPLTISGVAITDVGADVYASDGNTYTLTVGSNSFIGKIVRYVTTNTAMVQFNVGA